MTKTKSKLTAVQKLHRKKCEKTVVLEADFAGLKAGQKMLVATPLIVDAFIRKIPPGKHYTVPAMRNILARRHKCDGACPVSTAIFTRMSAEAALEELAEGKTMDDVAPFWRILKSEDKIAKRLKLDPLWIDNQRAAEGITA